MFEAWNVAKGRNVQGGRILSQGTVCLAFSLIIIQDSFRTIRNHGSIHINVEVFRNIFYSYLQ
jgi:hypothetical protein